MNSLYSLCRRQVTLIQQDLLSLEINANDSCLIGEISVSLNTLNRTLEDYYNLALKELLESHKQKALTRVARFREDYISLRRQFDKIKSTGANQRAAADRDSLLHSTSSARSPSYLNPSHRLTRPPPSSASPAESPFNAINAVPSTSRYQLNNPPGTENNFGQSIHNNPRTNAALNESSFLTSTGSTLDMYIAQGQAVLGNLSTQRDVLKGTRTRLLSAANTLGLSRNTIQFIERRTKGDFYILIGGGAFTLFSFYLILRWFG